MHPKYFDLTSYFEKEAARLQQQNFYLTKTITKNNEQESKTMDTVNWMAELKPFMECDINRAAWMNSYSIDSTFSEKNSIVKYSAKDSSLNVSLIQIVFSENIPESIKITRKNDKQFFEYITQLSFIPGKYYSIDNLQRITFTESIRIKIEAEFIKKTFLK